MSIGELAKDVLDELKKKYPAFLIESHFQYEFAFVLADKYGMDVHLERYAKPTGGKNSLEGKEKDSWRVDLEAISGNESYMFEFKYPTAKVDVRLPGRNLTLHLKNQSGGKDKKSEIWRDIEKLEDLKRSGKCTEACFVMLTNDWGTVNSRSKGANSVLDIWEGRECPGGDFIYTKVENKQVTTHTIHITNPYTFDYKPYSTIDSTSNDSNTKEENRIFKSLILPIK